MAYRITTDCEWTGTAGGDQEGPSRQMQVNDVLSPASLGERILAAVRLAVNEHLRQTQAETSTFESEDSKA